MKFKHTFQVFIDNFATTYKLLLYKLIVTLVTVGLCCAIILPILSNITGTAEYISLRDSVIALWNSFINLETNLRHDRLTACRSALDTFLTMLGTKTGTFVLCAVLLLVVYLINRFLSGIGTYTTGSLINDRMALRTNSAFIYTMTKNLGKASLFSVIYVPVCFAYDLVCALICFGIFTISPLLIKIFALAVLLIVFSALKNTFVCDWLPSIIHGKMTNGQAISYAISRTGKKTAHIFSNLLVIQVIIVALNMAAFLLTFGAGLLITLPASYIILNCFQFVNYYDGNAIRYFLDENTIVGPERDRPLTREEFFRGEEE